LRLHFSQRLQQFDIRHPIEATRSSTSHLSRLKAQVVSRASVEDERRHANTR